MNKESSPIVQRDDFSLLPIYILGVLIIITIGALIWFLISQTKTGAAPAPLEFTLTG